MLVGVIPVRVSEYPVSVTTTLPLVNDDGEYITVAVGATLSILVTMAV